MEIKSQNRRLRDGNTMKLVKKRPRPDLPQWYSRSSNRTYFKKRELSKSDLLACEYVFWMELKYINEDRDRLDRTETDKKRVAEAVCSRLRLGEEVTDRVAGIAERIDGRRLNHVGGLRGIAIGAIAFAVNEKRQRVLGDEFEFGDRIEEEEEFQELAERLEVDWREATKQVKKAMNERSRRKGYDEAPDGSPPGETKPGERIPVG